MVWVVFLWSPRPLSVFTVRVPFFCLVLPAASGSVVRFFGTVSRSLLVTAGGFQPLPVFMARVPSLVGDRLWSLRRPFRGRCRSRRHVSRHGCCPYIRYGPCLWLMPACGLRGHRPSLRHCPGLLVGSACGLRGRFPYSRRDSRFPRPFVLIYGAVRHGFQVSSAPLGAAGSLALACVVAFLEDCALAVLGLWR